jgi:hypothetical protein
MAARSTNRRLRARSLRRRARLALVAILVVPVAATACLPSTSPGTPGPSGITGGSGAGQASAPPPTPVPTPSGPTPRPSFVPPTPTPAPTFFVYRVARGDNLNTIAHRFGTTARSIAFWNRSTYPSLDPESKSYRPDLVQVGWTLMVIPNVVFDEQELPEPSDLVGPSPSATDAWASGGDEDAAASDDGSLGGDIDPNAGDSPPPE